ncbi:MAG: hypothetical protein ACREDZ_06910, partial [Kiloniellales bacterium]
MGGRTERSERQGACVEAHVLDYVQRLRKHRARRRAIHVHLSRLKDYNRQPHHLRIVASTLEPLARAHEGALFRLANGDMLVVCNGATLAQMGDPILRLRYLFGADPLLTGHEEDDGFCSWYDLEEDYACLLALAEELATAAGSQSMAKSAGEPRPPSLPLDPRRLAAVEAAIAQADLSSMMRR